MRPTRVVNRREESTFQARQISIDRHQPNCLHHHHHHYVHLDWPPGDIMVGLEGELVQLANLIFFKLEKNDLV